LEPASQTFKTQGTTFPFLCWPLLSRDIQFRPVKMFFIPPFLVALSAPDHAMTAGSGRSPEASRESCLSRKMSRLALSRAGQATTTQERKPGPGQSLQISPQRSLRPLRSEAFTRSNCCSARSALSAVRSFSLRLCLYYPCEDLPICGEVISSQPQLQLPMMSSACR
jgi:hypothetical protein